MLFCSYSIGQHPASISFAEKEFRGVDIYDVIQDDRNNYWFATNQGIRKHNGYSFQHISCPEMQSQSVFNWVSDQLGNIYCFNLQHQIFRVRDGKIELYYEIPEAYRYHETKLKVDPENNLLIQSKGLIQIAPDKKTVLLHDALSFPNSNAVSFEVLPDGSSITVSNSHQFLLQKNGKTQAPKALQFEEEKFDGTTIFNWFKIGQQLYGIDYKTMNVFLFNAIDKTFKFVKRFDTSLVNSVLRIYVTEDHLWLAGIANGIQAYDHNLNPVFNGNRIFANNYISDIFTDHEGNILLSTFNEGVMLIFNPNVIGFDFKFGEKFSHITSTQSTIFATSNKGNVYAFINGESKLIYSDPLEKEIQTIQYWEERDLLFMGTGNGLVIGKWNGAQIGEKWHLDGSFKNAFFQDDHTAIMAFNFGVQEIHFTEDQGIQLASKYSGRAYCAGKSAETIYAGVSSGLIQIDSNQKATQVTYKGMPISAISMAQDNSQLYFGTRKNGLLVCRDNKIIDRIPFEGPIRKIEVRDAQLYVLTNRAIYRVNKDGTQKEKLNKANGLLFEYVSDFHLNHGRLYTTNSESMQYIDLDQLNFEPSKIPIRFVRIAENNKKITDNSLPFDAKNIEFGVAVSTLRYRGEIQYKYRLIGFNDQWKLADYAANKINFAALPPGNYTLEVVATNGTIESDTIRYSFQVNAPYYQQWWFYVIIIIASGLLIALLFLQRIRVIRKKNRARLAKQQIQSDMLESELKALRSQMNPHFIFNSLNSIQDLILQEETDASYDYIVLFAELVRSALNNSNKDFIPIDQEIEFINVYLQLEKLRFKEDLKYSIENNAPDFVNVPSMLIQPFIENALLHGLLHKEGEKQLNIRFEFNETLVCFIQDNGIGRKRAAEIQERQGRKHESFALDAINKRLTILNEKLGNKHGTYNIEDAHSDEKDSGTLVTIQLPFQRDY